MNIQDISLILIVMLVLFLGIYMCFKVMNASIILMNLTNATNITGI